MELTYDDGRDDHHSCIAMDRGMSSPRLVEDSIAILVNSSNNCVIQLDNLSALA